jgi:hypothetical protein
LQHNHCAVGPNHSDHCAIAIGPQSLWNLIAIESQSKRNRCAITA